MNVPKPRAELVIQVYDSGSINIYCASNDAAGKIEEAARLKYVMIDYRQGDPMMEGRPVNHYRLECSAIYHAADIVAWLADGENAVVENWVGGESILDDDDEGMGV